MKVIIAIYETVFNNYSMIYFQLFLERFLNIKGALYIKDLVPYLTVFILGVWSWFSLSVLHKLTDTFF